MSDQSADVAQFIMVEGRGVAIDVLAATIRERWPSLPPEGLKRAVAISQELLRAEAAEHFACADVLDAQAARASR